MPDSGGPPQCNPACQKIVLDGDLLGAVFSTTGQRLIKFRRKLDFAQQINQAFASAVDATYEFIHLVRDAIGASPIRQAQPETCEHMANVIEDTCQRIEAFGRPIPHSEDIIGKLIVAEDLAFSFQRAVLEGMGYHGPQWPKCLQ